MQILPSMPMVHGHSPHTSSLALQPTGQPNPAPLGAPGAAQVLLPPHSCLAFPGSSEEVAVS